MSVGYLAAIPLQVPIQSGFWSMLAVAPLIWTVCATPGSRRTDLAAIALLCLASGVSVGRLDPDNLGLWLVVLVVSVGGGLIVGRSRRHTADSQLVAEPGAANWPRLRKWRWQPNSGCSPTNCTMSCRTRSA